MLWEDGFRSKSHSGVHSLYGEYFAKTGRLAPKYHRWMLDAFDQRLDGDYGFDIELSSEKTAELIDQAREFLTAAERFIPGDT